MTAAHIPANEDKLCPSLELVRPLKQFHAEWIPLAVLAGAAVSLKGQKPSELQDETHQRRWRWLRRLKLILHNQTRLLTAAVPR